MSDMCERVKFVREHAARERESRLHEREWDALERLNERYVWESEIREST